MTHLRYGVIGAGVISGSHLEAIAAIDHAEIVGLCDLDDTRGRRQAEKAGCAFFGDRRELFAQAPDIVVVCTPHPTHAPIAIEALDSHAHVLVEKPIAVEVREADAMIAAAERAGKLLAVTFQARFRPVIVRARELIASGELGALVRFSVVDPLCRPAIYYGTAPWRGSWAGEGGGVLMNQASHTLDVLCCLTGPPARVWGTAFRRSQPMEAEDTATAMFEYSGGAQGTLAVSTIEAGLQRIELVGDRGRIEILGDELTHQRFDPPLSEHLSTSQEMFGQPQLTNVESAFERGGGGDHFDVHRDFAAAVRTGGTPRAPAGEALWSLELANAITLSSHLDRPVTIPVDRAAYASLLADLRAGRAVTRSAS
jgi:predicted dehydrogenase